MRGTQSGLLKQSSAQILRDCQKRGLPCKPGSAGKPRRASLLSTDLISNCSIASDALLSFCPLDSIVMHHHRGGNTTRVTKNDNAV